MIQLRQAYRRAIAGTVPSVCLDDRLRHARRRRVGKPTMPVASQTMSAMLHLPRVLVAVLVLLTQWVSGPLVLPQGLPATQAEVAALFGGQFICHADGAQDAGPGTSTPDHLPGQKHDCALCPACHIAAAPMLVAPDSASLPVPMVVHIRLPSLPPPATGPPHPVRYAARPRGPPGHSA